MKTLKDLFELIGKAVEENKKDSRTWFIHYSGHVNLIDISFYPTGWGANKDASEQKLSQYLNDEDSIQSAYWFIKSRLKSY